jgi:hypothetical protein
MLELKDASLNREGRTLFSRLSMMALDGQLTCVTGPAASGKTALVRVLLGFLPLDEGLVSINGELLTPLSARTFRRMMTYLPQDLEERGEVLEERGERREEREYSKLGERREEREYSKHGERRGATAAVNVSGLETVWGASIGGEELGLETPLPCRGGDGGGVSIFSTDKIIQTPPLAPPLEGRGTAAGKLLPPRGIRGGSSGVGSIIIADDPSPAMLDWLRQQCADGRAVVVATQRREFLEVADKIIELGNHGE